MYSRKHKSFIYISLIVIILSIGLYIGPILFGNNIMFDFEYINTKDMTTTNIGNKEDHTNILSMLAYGYEEDNLGELEEVEFSSVNKTTKNTKKRIWYLPTTHGKITQYPSYNHFALDITSSNAYSENIYPVANGVVSSIYRDYAGAKIVTINHNINGVKYTSQYVHLSQYAKGLKVGKKVTINDCIGKMGRTGIATGVHLHFALFKNCSYKVKNDKCAKLEDLFIQGKRNYSSGFRGLQSVMKVPHTWNKR